MDYTYKILLWLHLLGVALGGAASFGHPVIGSLAARDPAARPFAMKAGKGLSTLGRAGIVLLVGSGLVMLWQVWSVASLPWSFWAKMALVVVLIVNVVMAGLAAKAAAQGDKAAAGRLPVHGAVGVVLMVLLLAFAVMAFR